MDRHIDETKHVIVSGKFKKNKTYKEQIIQEITGAICAMLNSNGGKVVIDTKTPANDTVGGTPFSPIPLVIRRLEQSMTSIIGQIQTVSNIDFQEHKESLVIIVKKADSLITTNYNFYLPSQSQVVLISPLEQLEKIKNDIINRKDILEPVQIGSHNTIFRENSTCDIHESKAVQFKYLEAHATKRTTLADRIIGKGNKFTCCFSICQLQRRSHILWYY